VHHATFGLAVLLAQDPAAHPAPRVVDARELRIEGQGFADTAAPWDRLPARARSIVRAEVWDLSRHSAGIAVRFATDARSIAVHWRLAPGERALVHMPATGASGVDLYARSDAGWRWLGCGQPRAEDNVARFTHGLEGIREFLLYLPLFHAVLEVGIEVPVGAKLDRPAPRPEAARAPIVFYGTSITQGASASRPGMCHVAMLGRQLDREVVNLGFSGQGRLDLELADLLGEIAAAVYVLDCLPNLDAKDVTARAVAFVRQLRQRRPETPIVLVEDRTLADAWARPERAAAHADRRAALRAAFTALQAAGVGNLHHQEGHLLLGDDAEATVDGSHPTDLGFARQAAAMLPLLRGLLRP
jgi:hypothetical protein